MGADYNRPEYPFVIAHIESLRGNTTSAKQTFLAMLMGDKSFSPPTIVARYQNDPAMKQAMQEKIDTDAQQASQAKHEKFWSEVQKYLPIAAVAGLTLICCTALFFVVKNRAWVQFFLLVALAGLLFFQSQNEDGTTLLSFICSTTAAILAFQYWKKEKQTWSILYGSIALLFNPILRLKLEDGTWMTVYATSFMFVMASIPLTYTKHQNNLQKKFNV